MSDLYDFMHTKFKDGLFVSAPNVYYESVQDNQIIPEDYSAIAKYRLISYAISRKPLNNFFNLLNSTTTDGKFDFKKYSDNIFYVLSPLIHLSIIIAEFINILAEAILAAWCFLNILTLVQAMGSKNNAQQSAALLAQLHKSFGQIEQSVVSITLSISTIPLHAFAIIIPLFAVFPIGCALLVMQPICWFFGKIFSALKLNDGIQVAIPIEEEKSSSNQDKQNNDDVYATNSIFAFYIRN